MAYIYWCDSCQRPYEEEEKHETCAHCGEEWDYEGEGEIR